MKVSLLPQTASYRLGNPRCVEVVEPIRVGDRPLGLTRRRWRPFVSLTIGLRNSELVCITALDQRLRGVFVTGRMESSGVEVRPRRPEFGSGPGVAEVWVVRAL